MNRLLLLAIAMVLGIHAGPDCARASEKDEALISASMDGDIGAVEKALAQGANINAKASSKSTLFASLPFPFRGATPLIIALSRDDISMARLLLSRGADVHALNLYEETALHHAASAKDGEEIVALLLSQGADKSARTSRQSPELVQTDYQTPLHFAAAGGRPKAARRLLNEGADVDARDLYGQTPLHVVTDVDCARVLISRGAKVEARSNSGTTPLMRAVYRTEVARLLVANGANPNARDEAGWTPLVHAARSVGVSFRSWRDALPESVEFLLANGAQVDAKDPEGRTPLMFCASSFGNGREVSRILIRHGADIHARDSEDRTVLMMAHGRNEAFSTLVLTDGFSDSPSVPSGNILYENAFDQAQAGVHEVGGVFAVKLERVNKFLELPGAPLDTYKVCFGPSGNGDVQVSARIFATSQRRRFPTFGVGLNGVDGYRMQVAPGTRQIELFKGEEVVARQEQEWESGHWTMFKLEARRTGGGMEVQGKVWREGNDEPRAWQITYVDKGEPSVLAGRASVWGSPFSGTPIRFDDWKVEKLPKNK